MPARIVLTGLPPVVLGVFATIFLAIELPRAERAAENDAALLSEATAAHLREYPAEATFTWRKDEGVVSGKADGDYPPDMPLAEWHPVSRSKSRTWGWLALPGRGRLVWIRGADGDEDAIYALETDISRSTLPDAIRIAIPVSIAATLAMAAFVVASFSRELKMRDEFMSAAAHDLSTPLSALRIAVRTDPETAANIAGRLVLIVDNIRDFMRTGGRPPPKKEAFPLADAYSEAYALFRQDFLDILGKDVPVAIDGDPPVAFADKTLFMQIAWNVLGNALKYAAPYGPVRARFGGEPGFAVFELADEGPGMTKAEASKAFDRYYRARNARKSGKGGFGIGLCTAREFAAAMGGELSIAPNCPKGCVFTLKLPAAENLV